MKVKALLLNTIEYLKMSLKRFPATILTSTVLVIMLIITREQSSNLSTKVLKILQRINMIIALGIPLSLCIKLIFEKKKVKRPVQLLAYILSIGFLVFYYFYFLPEINMVSSTRYIAVNLFLYLAFMYIPWLGNKEGYEFYVVNVLGSFFVTVIYSFVLYIGFTAIIFSIDNLFSANIDGLIYYYMFLIIVGIFAPSYFLAKIPYSYEDYSNSKLPKAFRILILYIIIPLIVIYTAILYAYFIKIIVTRNWPINLISHLVLWYSVVSVGVIFFIAPIVNKNKIAKYFIKWFPKIIIPMILMMFSSMYIRINEYGITENRYYVLVLGLWVFIMMLYFSIRKDRNNIVIPILLSILVLNSTIGPLSSYSLSKYSQNKRLEKILIRNHMVEDNKLVKASSNISLEDKIEISNILDYFNRSHDLGKVKYLSQDFDMKDMEEVFGFSFAYGEKESLENHFYYDDYWAKNIIDIKDYDYYARLNNGFHEAKINKETVLKYDAKKFILEIVSKKDKIYEKNIHEILQKIYNEYEDKDRIEGNINPEDLVFQDENEKIKILFIIKHISGVKEKSNKDFKIEDGEFNVLIKIK